MGSFAQATRGESSLKTNLAKALDQYQIGFVQALFHHRQFPRFRFTDHWPLFSCDWPLSSRHFLHWPAFSRPKPHSAGRKLGLFSCSTPPWFVLSHNIPMTNTTSNWLCSDTFLSPPVISPR